MKNNKFNRNKKKYFSNLILLFLLIIINTYIYENFCLECIKKVQSDKCSNCKNNIIFKGLKILDEDKTLNELIYKNKSISRFGDGEFNLIFGKSLGFQKYNKELSQRLLKILNTKEKDLLIGINIPYQKKVIETFNSNANQYYIPWVNSIKFKLANILKQKEYYSSRITRFYVDLLSKKRVSEYIKRFKLLWNKKDIVIIEGEKSRLGIGNDFFNNSNSIQRIICPTKNAFNYYKKILNTIDKKISKNKLILIALGPTATVLSYDLYKLGYQVIDIGHADIEYEWYLKKAKTKIAIKNKYVNEKGKKQKKFTKVKDKNYYKQIISKISL